MILIEMGQSSIPTVAVSTVSTQMALAKDYW
jgi:hypothetical protein